MIHLVVAEGQKVWRAPFAHGVAAFVFFVPLIVLLVSGLYSHDNALRYPQTLNVVVDFSRSFLYAVPAIFLSWLISTEQSNDTWKLLLTRHTHRASFIVAKSIFTAFASVVFFTGAALVWIAVSDVAGRLSGGTPIEVTNRADAVVNFGCALVTGIAVSSSAALSAVVVRKNGAAVGLAAAIGVMMLGRYLDTETLSLSMVAASGRVALAFGAVNEDTAPVTSLPVAVMALMAWTFIPIIAAAAVFNARDIESGAG